MCNKTEYFHHHCIAIFAKKTMSNSRMIRLFKHNYARWRWVWTIYKFSMQAPTGLLVVRTGWSSMGEAILYTSPKSKLLHQTIPIFKRMITLVKERELSNFVAIGSTGAALHVSKMYSYRFSFFLLLSSSSCFRQFTYRPQFAMDFDVWWPKDVLWRKDVPFECPKCSNELSGLQNPCFSREIPAETKNIWQASYWTTSWIGGIHPY